MSIPLSRYIMRKPCDGVSIVMMQQNEINCGFTMESLSILLKATDFAGNAMGTFLETGKQASMGKESDILSVQAREHIFSAPTAIIHMSRSLNP